MARLASYTQIVEDLQAALDQFAEITADLRQ
jgi:hypothetical protein